jgi:uncharacterized PurR-regulated membrane protein YhhQ (DUF165 family)
MESYYVWIIVFSIIGYVIVSDKNVVDAFVYVFDIVKNRITREFWWLKNNPSNPIVKYLMWRRSIKLAKELQKELTNRDE